MQVFVIYVYKQANSFTLLKIRCVVSETVDVKPEY